MEKNRALLVVTLNREELDLMTGKEGNVIKDFKRDVSMVDFLSEVISRRTRTCSLMKLWRFRPHRIVKVGHKNTFVYSSCR